MPPKGRIEVNELYCKACELCIESCPQHVIRLAMDRFNARGFHPAELFTDGCTGCGVCAVVCPEAAITVFREVAERKADGG